MGPSFLLKLAFGAVFLAALNLRRVVDSYACKSSSGANVDWFYALKMPNLKAGKSSGDGTDYVYVDANSVGSSWRRSDEGVDKTSSNIGRTVSQIFTVKKTKSDFFAVYNDEDANTNRTEFNRGHMKGVLAFDDFEGFWLVHSVPRFPATLYGAYAYPATGKRYGQAFLCVTFPTHLLNDIGIQLQFAQPTVFDMQMPAIYEHLYPNLAAALDRKMSRLPKHVNSQASIRTLRSLGGTIFTSFTKSTKFGKDLYSDLVAPGLSSSLYVETWLNGGADLPSDCGEKFQVYNLRSIHPFDESFNSSKDHSKWAVSKASSDAWICVGDINRQPSQFHRGGGTLCQRNSAIASLFRDAIGKVECCGTTARNIAL